MELDGHARDDTETSQRSPTARRCEQRGLFPIPPSPRASAPACNVHFGEGQPLAGGAAQARFASTCRPLSRRTCRRWSPPRGISQCS
jgi:hypothetical protein